MELIKLTTVSVLYQACPKLARNSRGFSLQDAEGTELNYEYR